MPAAIARLLAASAVLVMAGAGVLAADPTARLSGIVITAQDRVAIFTDASSGVPLAVRVGEQAGPLLIQSIDAGSVQVLGPEGVQTLEPQPSGQALPAVSVPAQSPVLAGAEQTGRTIGRLAALRDGCVRQGHLPRDQAGNQDRLRAMLDSMAALPQRSDTASTDAPGSSISAAMRAGWQTSVRDAAGDPLDAARCRTIDAQWSADAPRYGLR